MLWSRWGRPVLLLALVALSLAVGFVSRCWYDYRQLPLHQDDKIRRVAIPLGAGPVQTSAALRAAGIEVPPVRIAWIFRLRGDAIRYKAGTYEIPPGMPLADVLDRFAAGEGRLSALRIAEGITFKQLRTLIDLHPELNGDSKDLDEPRLLARIGAAYSSPEGLFFPDTYQFPPGGSALQIYRQAYRAMERVIEQAWSTRAPGLPLENAYQAIVLASIIEKETGRPDDRERVAAVFINRLRRGMPLQSDPTTIYALGEAFDGRLRRRDLQLPHPHNTYFRTGLPPTPIALPSRAAIIAALQPATTGALFFVARGDGSSEFSDDLEAHNRAVSRYLLKK